MEVPIIYIDIFFVHFEIHCDEGKLRENGEGCWWSAIIDRLVCGLVLANGVYAGTMYLCRAKGVILGWCARYSATIRLN
jgi:hypothetical protein